VKLRETPLRGAYVIELEPLRDERGWFARTFDAETFAELGLDARVSQCNTSFNESAGTLRGMHFQTEPHGETKLVRCTRGAVYDVLVDVRPDSPSFRAWFGLELRAGGTASLFAPAGLAHGFQTLEDASEVHYQMGHHYVATAASGVRWDDPAFAIQWPEPPPGGRVMSERDAAYPDFAP
jgi:dTDP-4-dehydrorhamnose 3,5-epimerase